MINNKSNKKLNNKLNKKTSKKLNNKSNNKLNNKLNKKTSKKTSKKLNNKSNKKLNKKSNIKPNKKLNKKGGNNESINSNIVVTEVGLETVNITKEQFKKLLLINTFYEVYPTIVDINKSSETPATQPRTKRKIGNIYDNFVPNPNIFSKRSKNQQGGNSDDIFLLLSYLDNVHDFAGNNRCKINKHPKFFKDYIKHLYINLGLEISLINEYDHKEGIILYKMLEKNPGKYQQMVFKMNKNYAKNLPTLSRNIGEKNEYIVQILDDKTIPKEAGQCILYDSPVYRLNDYDLVNEKNYIFTSMEIKNDSVITTPPEKLFDSGTGYKNGICIKTQPTNALPTSVPNISLDYYTYPLLNILKLPTSIPYKIEFKKELDKLCYMLNCEIYNSNSGYSVRQLKEWMVENIGYFKSNSTTVTNPLINREHMNNLNIFINELLRKLINISKFNELNIRNQDLLKFYIAMSIKRLGDWGMVERNKKDKNIFITNDTLCALYAILRDSKLIFHVPSTYSKKLKGHGFMKDISDKNMGLIGFYNLNGDETIETIEPNPELDKFIETETNIIKNTIVQIGGEEINSDIKFISQNL